MTKEFEIAISFAGEDRGVASEIANELRDQGIRVFYDDFESVDLWGKNLYDHLTDVYRDKSEYCLMLISKDYSRKLWTSHERKAAQARAFSENREYILPLRLDDALVDGILDTTGYLDYRNETPQSVAQKIKNKLWGDALNDPGVLLLRAKLEILYNRVMGLCDISLYPENAAKQHDQRLKMTLLKEAANCFGKTKSDFVLNAPQINSLILASLSRVMDGFENLIKRANFLLLLADPSRLNCDFISEIPDHDLHVAHDFLYKLNVFEDYAGKKRYYTPQEIIESWRAAEAENTRYFSEPTKYRFRDGRIPFVFNFGTLRKLRTKGLSDGVTVSTFLQEEDLTIKVQQ